MPFLSIVTRTHPRPVDYLRHNQASLAAQSAPDYEQIVIRDEVGRGLAWANAQFYEHRHAVQGEYVLMLDDDNVLCEPLAIQLLKSVTWDLPDAVIFRADVGPYGVLPSAIVWTQRQPIATQIDGQCAIVRRALWQATIHEFVMPFLGDAQFFDALWRTKPRIEWLNVRLVRALAVGSLSWSSLS